MAQNEFLFSDRQSVYSDEESSMTIHDLESRESLNPTILNESSGDEYFSSSTSPGTRAKFFFNFFHFIFFYLILFIYFQRKEQNI